MNRCLLPLRPPGAISLALLLGLSTLAPALLPLAASAQEMRVRQFPPAAKRGMLTVTAPPTVTINGKEERLAPGVRIRNPNNLLVMSSALVGQTIAVNYLREGEGGMLREIWILNAAELEEQRGGMETITNFIFGSSGEKPKTDDGKTPFDQLPKFPKQ